MVLSVSAGSIPGTGSAHVERKFFRVGGEYSDANTKNSMNPKLQAGDDYHSVFFENSPNDLFVLDVRPDGRFVFEHVNPMVT
ncbi:MAG: hypothetical protein JO081_07000, partial [Alphaproteobacteria bacterium]|nr:hypothetical protein [Alphaproteobacteria bacterium]